MITRFKDYPCQNEFGKEHRSIVCVDSELLSQSLWRSEQEKPVGL